MPDNSKNLTLVFCLLLCVSVANGQDQRYSKLPAGTIIGIDMMDTRNFTLLDYKRIFQQSPTPTPEELIGTWRGVNKGVATLAGFKQFIKEIEPHGCATFGVNVQVHQVSNQCLRCMGWQPKFDDNGMVEKRGRFEIKQNGGFAAGRGLEFSYRDGGNPKMDASKLLVDKVVKINDNTMLGRASARFGLVRIPVAFFVLERIH